MLCDAPSPNLLVNEVLIRAAAAKWMVGSARQITPVESPLPEKLRSSWSWKRCSASFSKRRVAAIRLDPASKWNAAPRFTVGEVFHPTAPRTSTMPPSDRTVSLTPSMVPPTSTVSVDANRNVRSVYVARLT